MLDAKLDELAWAATWGNFSAGTALGDVAGTAADVIAYSGKINQYVYELEPEQLRAFNEKRLAAFCSDDFAVRQFSRRGGFTEVSPAGVPMREEMGTVPDSARPVQLQGG